MLNANFIETISEKISQIIEKSPAGELEKNLRALLQGAFAKLDLVTREEFDAQFQVLLRTREQLNTLELRVKELEARLTSKD
jgi:BMFP domain-containing protein YqiC